MKKLENLFDAREYDALRCPSCGYKRVTVKLDDILGQRVRFQCYPCRIRVQRRTVQDVLIALKEINTQGN